MKPVPDPDYPKKKDMQMYRILKEAVEGQSKNSMHMKEIRACGSVSDPDAGPALMEAAQKNDAVTLMAPTPNIEDVPDEPRGTRKRTLTPQAQERKERKVEINALKGKVKAAYNDVKCRNIQVKVLLRQIEPKVGENEFDKLVHTQLEKYKSVFGTFEDKYENLLVSGCLENFQMVQDEWNEAWKDGGELASYNEQIKFANQRIKKNDNPNTPRKATSPSTPSVLTPSEQMD